MEFIKPKNWADFQHYKDRSPTWIKLHKSILDNYDYQRLPLASKALAPMLWLLASEYDEGKIPLDYDLIAFRLRVGIDDLKNALSPLIHSRFFVCNQDASEALAECLPREEDIKHIKQEEKEKKYSAVSAKRPRKQKTAIPESFEISERVSQWALSKGHTRLGERLEHFVSCAKAKGYTYVDWDEAFMGAIRDDWAKLADSKQSSKKPALGVADRIWQNHLDNQQKRIAP